MALAFDEFARDASAAPRGPWQRKRALGPLLHEKGLAYDPLNDMDQLRRQFDDALADRGFAAGGAAPLAGAALWRVARALVAAALYPQVLKIEKPSQRRAARVERGRLRSSPDHQQRVASTPF